MRAESGIGAWVPGVLLLLGSLGLLGANRQVEMSLIRPLDQVLPDTLLGLPGTDRALSPEERAVSGVSQYAFRIFQGDSGSIQLSVYVGYYEAQSQGKSIHSPKNCLPGAGWEPIANETRFLDAQGYRFPVNRYVLENKGLQAVIYYWYQGRGRISANEYHVKWELVRDRALAGRSDEALVRIMVPVTPGLSLAGADSIASRMSAAIVRPIYSSLPGFPNRGPPLATSGS